MKRTLAVILALVLTLACFGTAAYATDTAPVSGVFTGTARAMKGDLILILN